MSIPKVYMFVINHRHLGFIVEAIVEISEESAKEAIELKYPKCLVQLVSSCSVNELGNSCSYEYVE